MIVAQITDMHVTRRGRVLPHMPHVMGPLRRALAAIEALREPPAVIVATGDLTESGHPDEYRRLRDILEPVRIPVYLLPGNHDRRDNLRAAFHDRAYLRGHDAVLFTVELPHVRIVGLDSSDAPRQGGYLDAKRLAWLDERLRERPQTPTILATHHPPFATGLSYFDHQPFEGRERLGEIVRAHPQIRRLICGHIHQAMARRWSGTLAVSGLSTAPSLVAGRRAPGFFFEAGGFVLHRCDKTGRASTKVVRTAFESVAIGA